MIDSIRLKYWKCFGPEEKFRLHEHANIVSLMGGNGVGKSSLLDAIVFACNQYRQSLDLLDERACVTLLSSTYTYFTRTAGNKFYINDENVEEDVYTLEVSKVIPLIDMSIQHNWHEAVKDRNKLTEYLELLPIKNLALFTKKRTNFKALNFLMDKMYYQDLVGRREKLTQAIVKGKDLIQKCNADLAALNVVSKGTLEYAMDKSALFATSQCLMYSYLTKKRKLATTILNADELLKLTTVTGSIIQSSILIKNIDSVSESSVRSIEEACRVDDLFLGDKLNSLEKQMRTLNSASKQGNKAQLVDAFSSFCTNLIDFHKLVKENAALHEVRSEKILDIIRELNEESLKLRPDPVHQMLPKPVNKHLELINQESTLIEAIPGVIGLVGNLVSGFDNTLEGRVARTLVDKESDTVLVMDRANALKVLKFIRAEDLQSRKIVPLAEYKYTSSSSYSSAHLELRTHCSFSKELKPVEAAHLNAYLFAKVVEQKSLEEAMISKEADPTLRIVCKSALLDTDGCWTPVAVTTETDNTNNTNNTTEFKNNKTRLIKEFKMKLAHKLIEVMTRRLSESREKIKIDSLYFQETYLKLKHAHKIRDQFKALQPLNCPQHLVSGLEKSVRVERMVDIDILAQRKLKEGFFFLDSYFAKYTYEKKEQNFDLAHFSEMKTAKEKVEKEQTVFLKTFKEFRTKVEDTIGKDRLELIERNFESASEEDLKRIAGRKEKNLQELSAVRAQRVRYMKLTDSRKQKDDIEKEKESLENETSRDIRELENLQITIRKYELQRWERLKVVVELLNPLANHVYRLLTNAPRFPENILKFELADSGSKSSTSSRRHNSEQLDPESLDFRLENNLREGVLLTCSINQKRFATPDYFSFGEGAIVSLAIALSAGLLDSKKIILADEVDVDLDLFACESLMAGLRTLADEKGLQILVTSHNPSVFCEGTFMIGLYRDQHTKASKLILVCNSEEVCKYDEETVTDEQEV